MLKIGDRVNIVGRSTGIIGTVVKVLPSGKKARVRLKNVFCPVCEAGPGHPLYGDDWMWCGGHSTKKHIETFKVCNLVNLSEEKRQEERTLFERMIIDGVNHGWLSPRQQKTIIKILSEK